LEVKAKVVTGHDDSKLAMIKLVDVKHSIRNVSVSGVRNKDVKPCPHWLL